jgi:transposase-like protein
MVKCPNCSNEVAESKKSVDESGFYFVKYKCFECGSDFKLEKWVEH